MVSLFPESVCERNVENAGCSWVSSRPGLVQKHVLEEAKTFSQHIAKSIHLSRMHPFNLHVTLGFFSLKVPLTKSMLCTRNTPHETRLELNRYGYFRVYGHSNFCNQTRKQERDFLCFTRDSNGSQISWQSGRSVNMRTIELLNI